MINCNMHIVTVGTDDSKMWALKQSAAYHDVELINLGEFMDWNDPMEGYAGMPKIEAVKEFLKSVPQNDVVMFMDAYDTFFADHPVEVLMRFMGFSVDILFGAEKEQWPSHEIGDRFPDVGTPYKYLNSGLYIGYAGKLAAFFDLKSDIDHMGDDQLYCQARYLNSPFQVALDVECYVFNNHEEDMGLLDESGQLWNPVTNCCPCVYHGNGPHWAKQKFKEMAAHFEYFPDREPKLSTAPIMDLDYEVVAPEIIVTDLLTDVQCQNLIDKCNEYGNWGSLEGDKFPAQEIRLKQLGLWKEYEKLWVEKLAKIAEEYWKPMEYLGLRDAFAMKYTPQTQKSLAYHTDASLVTGSVKLNEDYYGGELVFPRQDFTNKDVQIGKCILFPSEVTHGHHVPDVTSGVKYSLTMWTSRYEGDEI